MGHPSVPQKGSKKGQNKIFHTSVLFFGCAGGSSRRPSRAASRAATPPGGTPLHAARAARAARPYCHPCLYEQRHWLQYDVHRLQRPRLAFRKSPLAVCVSRTLPLLAAQRAPPCGGTEVRCCSSYAAIYFTCVHYYYINLGGMEQTMCISKNRERTQRTQKRRTPI